MSKFTPGPWRVVRDAQGVCGLMHPEKEGVAVAWFSSTFHPSNGYVGEEEHEIGRPEREANAALIAAAPELLEALERAACQLSVTGKILTEDAPAEWQDLARACLRASKTAERVVAKATAQ